MKVWDADRWPDPIGTFAGSRDLGFDPEPTAVPIAGTRWLTLGSLPWTTANFGGRLLLVGPTRSALFSTDYQRQHLVKVLWRGVTSDLRWRRLGSWLLRLETPNGYRFYVDASTERRKLQTIEQARE